MAAQYYDNMMDADEDKPDGQFCKWFATDDIFSNLTSMVSRVQLNPTPSISSCSDGELDGSDMEIDEIEAGEPRLALQGAPRRHPLPAGSELVVYDGSNMALAGGGSLDDPPVTPTQDRPSPLALPPPSGTPPTSPTSPTSSPVNMLVPISQNTAPVGSSGQAGYLPSSVQYPPLLSGTEVGRVGGPARGTEVGRVGGQARGTNNSTGAVANTKTTVCNSRGHHGRCYMVHHHYHPHHHHHHHHRTGRRSAPPTKALPPPPASAEGTSPQSLPSSPPTPDLSQFSALPQIDAGDEYVSVEESIISLLIKLHSKLTGKPNSYRPNFAHQSSDSRIGDGPFFIAKLLDRLGRYDSTVRQGILDTISSLYCKKEEDSSASSEEEARAREEKRKRAKERQKRVMQEFANRQRQFMEQNKSEAAETEGGGGGAGGGAAETMEVEEDSQPERHKEYDCVICNQSIPSTPERPVGLVVLLQATSVLGHRTSSQKPLSVPTTDQERERLKQRRYTLGQYMEEKADLFNRHFDYNSWLVSMNIGWEGGVHVQTCGHHLHLDCHQSYLLALRSPQRPNNPLNVDKGEYWCPLCRQLGNSVLPISPEIGDLSALVKLPAATCDSELVEQVDRLLADLTVPKFSGSLTNAMARMMEDMTVVTYAKYRNVSTNPSTPSLFMFVSSILRTNLEVELEQRGGNLLYQASHARMDLKRSCLMPLLHVLGFHSKILSGGGGGETSVLGGLHWIRQTWASITQRPVAGSESAVTLREREVPLLFRDPVALLLQLILLLPSRIDQGYFKCVVVSVYRVAVVRAAVSSLRSLTEAQREQATTSGPLAPLLALAFSTLRDSPFFCDDQVPLQDQNTEPWTVNDLTCQVRETCLLFLRVAGLLKAHLLEDSCPLIADPIAECGALEQYLGVWETCSVVNSAIMGKMCGSYQQLSSGDVSSPVETRIGDLAGGARVWCSEVATFASQAQVAASTLLTNMQFMRPRLLRLPRSYDAIFQYYHRRACSKCNSVPKDPSVCLLCGTIVCLREPCCKQQEVCECVQHATDCGAGTAIFLVINASTVIVIRGLRVCLWGCIHLDSFGEEDRELKRGKPLYLSEDRYRLLEQQWLSHSFDHTNRRWIWHRDIL